MGLGPAGKAMIDQLPRVSLPLTLPSKPGGIELWEKTKKSRKQFSGTTADLGHHREGFNKAPAGKPD